MAGDPPSEDDVYAVLVQERLKRLLHALCFLVVRLVRVLPARQHKLLPLLHSSYFPTCPTDAGGLSRCPTCRQCQMIVGPQHARKACWAQLPKAGPVRAAISLMTAVWLAQTLVEPSIMLYLEGLDAVIKQYCHERLAAHVLWLVTHSRAPASKRQIFAEKVQICRRTRERA